jgi:hypothetical protein
MDWNYIPPRHNESPLKRPPSHQDAPRAFAGTWVDDDNKAFLVELRKLAEQAQELASK